MAAVSGQWVPPLPPGWEARWDANQRAYFYINHQDRSTTWVDPRTTVTQKPQQAAYGQTGTAYGQTGTAYGQTGAGYSSTAAQKTESSLTNIQIANQEKVQKLKSWFPQCPEKVIKSALEKEKNNVGIACFELQKRGYKNVNLEHSSQQSPSRNADKVQSIQAMFPSASSNLIQDVLSGCGYNIEETKSMLKSLGYHPTSTSTNQHLTTSNAGKSKSPNKTASPNRSASPKHRSPSPATSQPKVSEQQKKQTKAHFEAQYKSLPPTVIEMAVEACDYNHAKIKRLLDLNLEEVERPKSSSSSRPFSGSSTASSIPTIQFPTVTSMQLEPVVFGADDPATAKTSTKSGSATGTKAKAKSKNVTPTRTSGHPKPSTSSKPATPSSSKSTPQKRVDRTKVTDVTRVSRSPKRTPVSTQPTYVSAYKTMPKGPDPNLRNGPDRTLLLPSSNLAQGPNPDNRLGPEAGLVQGPQGANGPDRTLRCGPQSSLLQTHNMRQHGGILVSEI